MNNHHKLFQAYLFHIALYLSTSASEYVPALIWESNPPNVKENDSFPALAHWPSGDFSDYITSKLDSYIEKPLIVVFLADYLNIEDWRGDFFPLLRDLTKNISTTTFITSVHKPYDTLQQIKPIHTVLNIENEPKQFSHNYNETTLIFIKINSTNQEETLSRHDKIITEVYQQLSVIHPNILAIHTGISSQDHNDSSPRTTRAIKPLTTYTNKLWRASSPLTRTNAKSSIFLYFFDRYPILVDVSNETSNFSIELTTRMIHDGPTLDEPYGCQRLMLRFRISRGHYITLRFRFVFSAQAYWSLPAVEYENSKLQTPIVLTTVSNIGAPIGYSYHCGETAMVFRNGTTSLVLRNIQTQPFLKGEKFDDCVDCVGYFSVAILSGILVVALLLGFFGCGIMMIMDIRTMDRFDDPKGKTIMVDASGVD